MARLLVVEDDRSNRELLEVMLGKLGHACTVLEDGSEVSARMSGAAAEGAPFDAVLMDVKLPGRDGLEITRDLRAGGDATPVVAVTAQALAGDRERCLEAGMNAYVAKPVTMELLVEALAEVGLP